MVKKYSGVFLSQLMALPDYWRIYFIRFCRLQSLISLLHIFCKSLNSMQVKKAFMIWILFNNMVMVGCKT